jgi:hypothetical protein
MVDVGWINRLTDAPTSARPHAEPDTASTFPGAPVDEGEDSHGCFAE